MTEEKKIADDVNEVIRKVFKAGFVEVDEEKNMRIAWTHATDVAQSIAMEALEIGKKLESISIVIVDGWPEVQFTMIDLGPIHSVSVAGIISV